MKTLIQSLDVTDEHGQAGQVLIYQAWLSKPPGGRGAGPMDLIGPAGNPVNRIDSVTFRDAVTNQVLKMA